MLLDLTGGLFLFLIQIELPSRLTSLILLMTGTSA
jgi:hypothetical protein